MKHKLKMHVDPGHGWLSVPMDLYVKSGITASKFSYFNRVTQKVYLEEDCDFPMFMHAIEKLGDTVEIDIVYTKTDSFIRRLPKIS